MRTSFRFTGRHMLAVMLLFFGVVIGVNVVMATYATRTFGGVVVENSYVASQKFNGWIHEAQAQERLGWKVEASAVDRRAVIAAPNVAGAQVSATARHPLGRMADVPLTFREVAPGRYVANTQLPQGRWRLHLSLVRGGNRGDFIQDVTA